MDFALAQLVTVLQPVLSLTAFGLAQSRYSSARIHSIVVQYSEVRRTNQCLQRPRHHLDTRVSWFVLSNESVHFFKRFFVIRRDAVIFDEKPPHAVDDTPTDGVLPIAFPVERFILIQTVRWLFLKSCDQQVDEFRRSRK